MELSSKEQILRPDLILWPELMEPFHLVTDLINRMHCLLKKFFYT